MSKHTLEYVKRYFEEQGCELLEEEYKNVHHKMKYKCSCGNFSKITFSKFKMGRRCMECKGNKKLTLKYVKQYFDDHGCNLLEKTYKNYTTKMKYKCSCGNISKTTFNNFKAGQRCSQCGGNKKLTFKYVQQYFKDHGCNLLEKTYKNYTTKMKYECVCKNVSKITFSDFKQGRRCKKCNIKKISGKNHHHYNPNLTDKERKIRRKYPEYYQWRKNVYKKDNFTCQCCGDNKGGNLIAHHIESWGNNKKLRLAKSNGITFCEKHHLEFHKIYGYGNNNRKQLDKFLTIQ